MDVQIRKALPSGREDDGFYGRNRKTSVGVCKGWCDIFVRLFKVAVISVVLHAPCLSYSAIKKAMYVFDME